MIRGGWHFGHPAFDPDFLRRSPDLWREFLDLVSAQLAELMGLYPPVRLIWLDGEWPPDGRAAVAAAVDTLRQRRPDLQINDRGSVARPGFLSVETILPTRVLDHVWEMTTPLDLPVLGGFWYPVSSPDYRPALPRDPDREEQSDRQYLYRSNGDDCKVIAHGRGDCPAVRDLAPGLVDPVRNRNSGGCWAYRYWSSKARDW